MFSNIKAMEEKHREEVFSMMKVFYASPAVHSNGSDEIFNSDIDNCINECPFLEGYVFEENGRIEGYAMLAKSFSTEFGKCCIWVEDLYFKPECRGKGLGTGFFRFLKEKYPDAVLRLEVEEDNEHAVHVYRKAGFDVLPYMEMKR